MVQFLCENSTGGILLLSRIKSVCELCRIYTILLKCLIHFGTACYFRLLLSCFLILFLALFLVENLLDAFIDDAVNMMDSPLLGNKLLICLIERLGYNLVDNPR